MRLMTYPLVIFDTSAWLRRRTYEIRKSVKNKLVKCFDGSKLLSLFLEPEMPSFFNIHRIAKMRKYQKGVLTMDFKFVFRGIH